MPHDAPSAKPKWFAFAVYAVLIWSLLGVVSFVMDVTTTEEAMSK